MNYIWSGIIIISLIFGFINGQLAETLAAGLDGAASAITVLLSFAGIMCFWSGILKIASECGASRICEKLLSPLIARLFPKVRDRGNITMNIIANLLGMGNAATPAGVAAMCELDELNGGKSEPGHEMCRFAVMNTASLQILPTTVIGILAACGAKDPYGIVPCVWISSVLSLLAALIAEEIIYKRSLKK